MDFPTLWRDGIGFWRVWIVTLGLRHGLFERLNRPTNGAVQVWREAAVALGLLVERRGRLQPAPGVQDFLLNPDHPDTLGGHLMFGALRSLDYEAMGDLLRKGRPLPRLSARRRIESVDTATRWDHVAFIRTLPRDVRARLEHGCDVLELGCGTGQWLRMMKRKFPRSRFRGVDPDPDTGAETGRAETAGATSSADLVYLGEVLLLTDRNRTLANCARVLRPGGFLLVLEVWMPERVSSAKWEAVLFAMQLDQALQGSRFMKRSDLRLPAAFGRPRFVTLGGRVALMVARRR